MRVFLSYILEMIRIFVSVLHISISASVCLY